MSLKSNLQQTKKKKLVSLQAVNVGLLGYDQDEVGNQYCCTFPFDKAVDPFGDVLVAYEMNGEPIPKPYGYPVRCIVPGHAGARNCKYLHFVCFKFVSKSQLVCLFPRIGSRDIVEIVLMI